MRIYLFSLTLFLLLQSNLSAQDQNKRIVLEGIVVDAENDPIPNAIIIIDDKRTTVVTNTDGKFKIKVKPSVSRIGIFTFGNGLIEEDIAGRNQIDFKFNTVSNQKRYNGITVNNSDRILPGNESVEIGYGHEKKRYITTDITYIDVTDKKYATYGSVSDIIQRGVSGVSVIRGQIVIQNSRNMFGPVAPLIIIDGVSGGSVDDISPLWVESISVLKGTAAAIYGSRGFGGVIIIKTRTSAE